MSVIRVGESATQPRGGVFNAAARTYTRHAIVLCDSEFDNPVSIFGSLSSLGIAWGQYYQVTDDSGTLVNYDQGAYIIGHRITQRTDNPFLWDVVVEYGQFQYPGGGHPMNAQIRSGGDPQQNPNVQPDPSLRRTQYAWTSVVINKPMDVDRNGYPVVNTAIQPFTNRPTREVHASRLTITRNEVSFDMGAMEYYRDTTNALPFLHALTGNAKMTDITAHIVYEGQYVYWEVNYVIDFLPPPPSSAGTARFELYTQAGSFSFNQITVPYSAWDAVILNQGRKDVNGKDIEGPNGRPTTTDVPLSAAGALLAVAAKPVYLLYARYAQTNWGPLALV